MKRRVKRKFRESSARRKRRKKLEAGPHKFLKHRKRIQLRDNPSKKCNALTWLVLIFGVGATISAFAKGKQ